jgi:hypothetical protein
MDENIKYSSDAGLDKIVWAYVKASRDGTSKNWSIAERAQGEEALDLLVERVRFNIACART